MDTTDTKLVPEEFARLGFSGLFWLEVAIDPDYNGKPPCLLGNTNWMLLSRNRENGNGVVVRKDAAAIVDVYTRRF